MILGLSTTLPHALSAGLRAHGVSASTAQHVAQLPPVSLLFAAFLGYNPIQHLLGAHALSLLSAASRATLGGRSFFPHLISAPFRSGLHETFLFAIVACLVAAAASLLRGGKYHHSAPAAAHTAVDGEANGRTAAAVITRFPTREEQHAS
jgi:hypothetical protein